MMLPEIKTPSLDTFEANLSQYLLNGSSILEIIECLRESVRFGELPIGNNYSVASTLYVRMGKGQLSCGVVECAVVACNEDLKLNKDVDRMDDIYFGGF